MLISEKSSSSQTAKLAKGKCGPKQCKIQLIAYILAESPIWADNMYSTIDYFQPGQHFH